MRQSVVTVACVVLVVLAGCAGTGPGPGTDPGTDPTTEGTTSTADPQTPANETLEVHLINVGQSVSTLIVAPSGETMLIDTGDFKDDGEYVLQYLKRHNIQRLEYLVTSHNDADHIGGNAAIIEYYETQADGIGAVYDPGIAASTQTYNEYLDAVETHEVPLYKTLEGDTIPMAGVTVEVLGPPQPYLESEARNENSIVLKLTYDETTFLFPGDAEDDQEQYLVDQYGSQLDVDVLKAGHHGSKSSSTGPFLDAVDPSVAIISSAYDSRYGHPNEETLQRLADRSIPAYWTGVHGDIVLVSDGQEITIATQAAAPTDPLGLRSAEAVAPESSDPVTPRTRLTAAGLQSVSGTPIPTATTTVATDGGPQIEVASVHADAEGDDRQNLNDEYIVLANTGDQTVDIGGWTITDAAGNSYTVRDGTTIAAGETVTIHTGSGTDTESDLYWGSGNPVWNNGGDTIRVTDANGQVVLETTYE